MKNPSTLFIVNNLQESKAFYINLLNFILIEEYDDCIKFRINNHEIIMFQGNLGSNDYKHGYHSNSTLLINVENLDEKIIELKSKGVVFIHNTPNENRWGRYSAFKAPSGIIHELIELKE